MLDTRLFIRILTDVRFQLLILFNFVFLNEQNLCC